MIRLIHNEIIKILYSRKLPLITIILMIFIVMFAYGENYTYKKSLERIENFAGEEVMDWKLLARQEINDLERRMNSPYTSEGGREAYATEIAQLNYFIERDINPITPGAGKFATNFAEQGLFLLFPLMVVILAADIISGEFSKRTIKILMTRAVPRWQVLLGKIIALWLMITLVIAVSALLAVGISGLFFGRWGLDEPVITGFGFVSGGISTDSVTQMTRLAYILMTYSLVWFVSLVIGAITFMISSLVKSTPAAIGIIMAALIGGQFLQFFLDEWAVVKYFFVTNMNLTQYLTGDYMPVEGLSMGFSVSVLLGWLVASLVIAFTVFQKRDILV